MNKLHIVDMFCGGGGESVGLIEAAELNGYKIHLTAINHWERAIETHAVNYPFAEHLCESIEHLDPIKVVPEQKLDLLWASPECTHHSLARGGRPRSEQSRATAWAILKWASELWIERIIIENVPEFLTWGPLDKDGKVIKSRSGSTFKAFVQALRSLDYTIDWRVLCAADYGVPTIRKRLFIQAVKGRKKIIWPQPTHHEDKNNLFGLPQWKSAREIIDWSIPCPSIFTRKKPLATATLRRIEIGVKKFGGIHTNSFLAVLRGTGTARDIGLPLPSITCSGAHHALVTPFVTAISQASAKDRSRSIHKPLSTICTKNEHCLVSPSFISTGYRFDIGFRMLQPHELALASGFPANYIFTGNCAERVKQIGNAVPPGFAKALANSYYENNRMQR